MVLANCMRGPRARAGLPKQQRKAASPDERAQARQRRAEREQRRFDEVRAADVRRIAERLGEAALERAAQARRREVEQQIEARYAKKNERPNPP